MNNRIQIKGKARAALATYVAFIAVSCALLVGWVMNIIALFSSSAAPFSFGEIFVRSAGIFIVPLGGVMGYL